MPPSASSASLRPKRRYTRLKPEQWAEARAAWTTGGVTAEELAARFGVSVRAIQLHMSQTGTVKGSAAVALAVAMEERVLAEALPDAETLATRIRQAKESAWQNAVTIENMVLAQIEAVKANPSAAPAAAAAVRMLDVAAAALSRTQRAKWAALGLDKGMPETHDLPELVIRELSPSEVAEIREQQLREDGERPGGTAATTDADAEEDDDVVVEGEDDRLPHSACHLLPGAVGLNEGGRVGGHDS